MFSSVYSVFNMVVSFLDFFYENQEVSQPKTQKSYNILYFFYYAS